MESLRGFHRSEQGLSERPLSSPKNRSVGRFSRGARSDEFLRCISGISSNSHDSIRLGEDGFYYSPRGVLLQGDAVWVEKRGSYLPKDDDYHVRKANWEDRGGLY
jgi:hypothetical protein